MHDGKFIVRVTIDGRGLDFILDTGASGIVIDDDVAKSLGLAVVGHERNAVNAGSYEQGDVIVPEMSVGPIVLSNVVVSTIPAIGEETPGSFKTVGLLGFDFINSMELVLDYEQQKVTAYAPTLVATPDDPHQVVIPIRLSTQTPLTDVRVNGELGERFTIDTGAADVGLLVFEYFARRYPDAVSGPPITQRNLQLSGIGGQMQYVAFRAKSITLANITFGDYDAYRITGTSFGGSEDGLIGPTFLQLYTVYVDYADLQMILVPNSLGRQAMGIKN